MSSRLLESLAGVLEHRNMLKHPFYQAWNEGKLTREMLKDYACQYYHFVKDFPRMVSAVHSNTPDLSVREPLLQNLMDEELGSENHPASGCALRRRWVQRGRRWKIRRRFPPPQGWSKR